MRTFLSGLTANFLAFAMIALSPDTGSGSGGDPVTIGATSNDPPHGDYVEPAPSQQTSAIATTDDTDAPETDELPARQHDGNSGGEPARQMA